jgi:hypothetical protein
MSQYPYIRGAVPKECACAEGFKWTEARTCEVDCEVIAYALERVDAESCECIGGYAWSEGACVGAPTNLRFGK